MDNNLKVPVPPYLPDTEVGRRDIRRMYSNILEMDYQVGEILKQLEEDGLMDSTIVVWYTDHGGIAMSSRLHCSFCKKSDRQVEKLVAGPSGVYICNSCVGAAVRIMDTGGSPPRPSRLRRMVRALRSIVVPGRMLRRAGAPAA